MSVNCQFITGEAGTGKTTSVKTMIELDPKIALMTSTTGVSAINLGCMTVNSALKYYDTDSLRDSFVSGHLIAGIKRMVTGPDRVGGLAIDEISMMEAEQLDIIYDAFEIVSKSQDVHDDLNLILTGDYAQLPPVKGQFAFEAKCWDRFRENTVKLTEVYRQTDEKFLQALNLFRTGDGVGGVDVLKACGVKFNPSTVRFPGTTIMPINDMVDRFNLIQFNEINKPLITVETLRTGQQLSEWKDPKIPDKLALKEGALVMILANDPALRSYANGDLGIIEGFNPDSKTFSIKLYRNNSTVSVGYVTRVYNDITRDSSGYRVGNSREAVGSVTFVPLRLAYATTVHKSQGLTLDRVQLDFRHRFFSNPSSMYVALSRVRSPQGLRLVGSEDQMIKRTKINPKVVEFL